MLNIRFIVRKDRVSLLGYPIILYININNKRYNFYTNIYVSKPEHLTNNTVSKKDTLNKEKNTKLSEILYKINTLFLEDNNNNLKENIQSIINHGYIIQKATLLTDAIEDFIKTKTSKGTISIYQGTIKKIKSFNASVTLEEVNSKWLTDFEKFCSRTMVINAYSIHLRNIRAVFNYLYKEDKIKHYPFKTYKIKTEKTIHRALTIEQVRKLKDIDCADYMKEYRDLFILMIYLIGINPKDLLYLTSNNIINERVTYHRAKTGKLYSIKLEPEAKDIISLYKGDKYLLRCMQHYNIHNDYVHHMNNALKKIGMTYINGKGYNKDTQPICPKLSAYWARHTWASLAFEIGIPKDVISLALGHSTGVEVTDIYIKYDWLKVDEANRKVIDYIINSPLSSQTRENNI